MFNDSSTMTTKKKNQGIKIVDTPYSKRESDPFNTKNIINEKVPPSITYEEKMKLVEKNQKYIDNQLRSISPFYNGRKNENFAPTHQKFVAVIGDKEKFDALYNYQNDHNKTNIMNATQDNKGFRKLAESKKENINSSNMTENSIPSKHNWWANKHDEVKAAEKAEMGLKRKNSSLTEKTYYGKKKVDYEENVTNKRTYLEEFNMKNNKLTREYIEKKIQDRQNISKHVLNKVMTLYDNNEKETIQNIFEKTNKSAFSDVARDHKKERALAKSIAYEKRREKIDINDLARKEIDDYLNMNEKLIHQSLRPSN